MENNKKINAIITSGIPIALLVASNKRIIPNDPKITSMEC